MYQLLLEYNYWAHRKLWDCILTISEADFKKPVSYSMGSVHQQVVHVMWAEAVWYARIHNEPRPEFTFEDFPTRDSIRAKWDEIEQKWRAYIANLTDAEANRLLEITRANGERYEHRVGEMILQIVNHGTDHRAQMLELIDGYGGQTFAQDIIYFLREKNAPSTD